MRVWNSMLCVDVNILVLAHHADSADHPVFRDWLVRTANGREPLLIPDMVASGFLRIVTSRRIFASPISPDEAWRRMADLLDAPSARLVNPGPHHWERFSELCREVNAKGNDVSDAYIAAYAIENGATLVSADLGFSRFKTLSYRHPIRDVTI